MLELEGVFCEKERIDDVFVNDLGCRRVALIQKEHIFLQVLHHVPLAEQVGCLRENPLDCPGHARIEISENNLGRISIVEGNNVLENPRVGLHGLSSHQGVPHNAIFALVIDPREHHKWHPVRIYRIGSIHEDSVAIQFIVATHLSCLDHHAFELIGILSGLALQSIHTCATFIFLELVSVPCPLIPLL